jgi:hypothetical protein
MASDTSDSGHPAREKEVERLAQELGRLIQSAEPEKREDLKELAFTLIREEIFESGRAEGGEEGAPPRPFNPLASGILILVLGAGLSFIFGPVGLTLVLGGLIFIAWGAAISWFKRK